MAKKPKNKNRGPQKPAAPPAPTASARPTGRGRNAGSKAVDEDAIAAPASAELSVAADASDTGYNETGFDDIAREDDSSVTSDADASAVDTQASADGMQDAGDAPATEPTSDADSDNAPAPLAAAMPAPTFDFAPVEVFDSGVGGGSADDIRGVLIQLAGARLLLPNATIAEVLSYAEPDAVEGTPDWLLGRIRWRGWQLPLIAFAQLAGITTERGGLGSKVVVLKSLAGSKTPYFAVLTQGFPRLVTVSRTALMVDTSNADLPDTILARVRLNQDDAFVPDLERVEKMIGEAMAEAA